MTELTAKSALEHVRELYFGSAPYEDAYNHVSRAIIETAIQTLERCARSHCTFCAYGMVPNKYGDHLLADNRLTLCKGKFEQRELSRLRGELKLLEGN